METKDKKKSKWKITAGVILIIQLLLSMATVGVVLWLNIVPTLYVILLGLIFLLLLIIEYCLFYFGKKKKGKKKTGCYVPSSENTADLISIFAPAWVRIEKSPVFTRFLAFPEYTAATLFAAICAIPVMEVATVITLLSETTLFPALACTVMV